MTEVKWGIIFVAIFSILVFGVEYEIQLVKGLTVTKIQYNLQLDTCLTDTLRKAEISSRNGDAFFYNPDRVRKELEKQLEFAFPDLAAMGEHGNKEKYHRMGEYEREEIYKSMALLILYEPDGFYFFEPEMTAVSEKVLFQAAKSEEKLSELEVFMETVLKKQLSQKGKRGGLCFTFPKEDGSGYAQTIKGTGLLLVYEAEEAYFKGNPYERFLLSGARVEEANR